MTGALHRDRQSVLSSERHRRRSIRDVGGAHNERWALLNRLIPWRAKGVIAVLPRQNHLSAQPTGQVASNVGRQTSSAAFGARPAPNVRERFPGSYIIPSYNIVTDAGPVNLGSSNLGPRMTALRVEPV